MKPLKVEAVKLYTEVPNRGCLRNGQKDFKKESLESKVAAIAIDEVHPITGRMVELVGLCIHNINF